MGARTSSQWPAVAVTSGSFGLTAGVIATSHIWLGFGLLAAWFVMVIALRNTLLPNEPKLHPLSPPPPLRSLVCSLWPSWTLMLAFHVGPALRVLIPTMGQSTLGGIVTVIGSVQMAWVIHHTARHPLS